MAKDSGGNTQTTTQSADPWGPAQPYLKDVMSQASGLYNSGQGFNAYPGSTVVPFSGQTTQALGGIENLANQGSTGLMGAAADIGKTASGDYLGGRNPYFDANLNKQAEMVGTDTQRNVDLLGRRGSGYNVNEVAGAVGDFRNKALQDNYNAERGYQMQAAQLQPSLYQSQYAPLERLASVGATQEDLSARTLQDLIDKYNTGQQAPWNRLSQYSALAGGPGSLGQSTTSSVKTPPNYAAPLGGAISGFTAGNMMFPGIGGLLGGLGGGALGLLGSGIF